jgi:uncharacterized protein
MSRSLANDRHNPRMGRILLVALAVVILVWLLRRALGSRDGHAGGKGEGAPPLEGDLVACAHCGVNLPKIEARSAGGRYFCSEEHWRLGPRDRA